MGKAGDSEDLDLPVSWQRRRTRKKDAGGPSILFVVWMSATEMNYFPLAVLTTLPQLAFVM